MRVPSIRRRPPQMPGVRTKLVAKIVGMVEWEEKSADILD
jgi:hypothetical protein